MASGSIVRAGLLATLACLATVPAFAQSGIKTFGDWVVGCDNTKSCRAIGTLAGESEVGSYLVIDRSAGPDAAPRLRFVLDNTPVGNGQGLTLVVGSEPPVQLPGTAFRAIEQEFDDRPEAFELVEPAAVARTLAAMTKGGSLRFGVNAPRASAPAVSLAGLADALRHMDEVQGRIDGATALVARGSRPASAVPAAPATPTLAVTIPDPSRRAPTTVPRALLERHARETSDDCDTGSRRPPNRIVRLSNTTVLYQIGCWQAAAQAGSMFYLATDGQGGSARRVDFETLDAETGRFGPPIQALTEPSGLEEMSAATLSSVHKDRGAGDCGTTASWVWTARGFRLSAYATMPLCKGITREDWITLWRTDPQ
ncbi:DUF1176 domain-containing protein [Phreatobacter sp. AB_2022a]|uniref:DUF1176 domain-containing protein n=1 Tax=Phreatobacter sp. AB_2022a TaxID=3003134 RepID=UPI002286CE2B|nr:DUF1176 domain-containing protein [Phreatobacter sp. AB_2022a]MCZ0734371.1 DUF1176 domain-containing protein [Phreatobacter sp. AB_2022a]